MKIVIVGASSGIGKLLAEEFAKSGYTVGIAARNIDALNAIKEEYSQNIECQRIDVTNPDSTIFLNQLINKIGKMDIYLHVSGICYENVDLNIDKETKTVETNVEGFTRLIDFAFNYFKQNNIKGQIAAITSVAGTKGIGDLPAYSASKRFQWNYLEALEQLAHKQNLKISFTDIRPGWTKTPLIDSSRKYIMAMRPEMVAKIAKSAIVRKKRVVYIDWRWHLLSFLWRFTPSFIWTRLKVNSSTSFK